MTPEIGKTYYRRGKSGHALVVRVLAVAEWVEYEVVHGPRKALSVRTGRCKVRNFRGWEEVGERDDYTDLDGCKIHATFLVLDTQGEPILRCGQKRADFYLRKGYARVVGDGVLQFEDEQTERRLHGLYLGPFSAFFLAVKNDRCVCCGSPDRLTRHHVVPRRHKQQIPLLWRRCLSNVLFLCRDCHERYERVPEPDTVYSVDWQEYARRWERHFLDALKPEHMPPGWSLIAVRNFDAVEEAFH